MIKYGSTLLGAKHLNTKAKAIKDSYSFILKDMKCEQCKDHSYFSFITVGNNVNIERTFCCKLFEERVNEKLRSQVS